MNVKHRFTRSAGTAAVALFLVTGAVFGANALGQAPTVSSTSLTTDESSPEPSESAKPSAMKSPVRFMAPAV